LEIKFYIKSPVGIVRQIDFTAINNFKSSYNLIRTVAPTPMLVIYVFTGVPLLTGVIA
jgi:hypothetical protein